MDCSAPGFPVHHQLPELAQTHVHPVGDAIQPSGVLECGNHFLHEFYRSPALLFALTLCCSGGTRERRSQELHVEVSKEIEGNQVIEDPGAFLPAP